MYLSKHKTSTSENTKHKHKCRIHKTVNEVKYFVLSCSLFNNFGSEGIAGHLSDLDQDVEIFLLE